MPDLLHPLRVAWAVLEGRASGWPALERATVKEVGHCECCGTKKTLQVHHKKPFHLFPELELERTNLMVLCARDHFFLGHLGDWKAWNPSVVNDVFLWSFKVKNRPYSYVTVGGKS